MTQRELIVYPNPQLLAAAVAERVLLTLNDVLCQEGRTRADIALTGGTDGITILQAIAASDLLNIVDWSRVHIWWGDERFVHATDADRNALQARRALLNMLIERALLSESQIHEMPADERLDDDIAHASDEDNQRAVDRAAEQYQQTIIQELGPHGSFDIVLFGIGPDGHFASLFPGRSEVSIDNLAQHTVGIINSPKMPPLRVSLTVPYITSCARVWVCASRETKAQAVLQTFSSRNNIQAPASFADATKQVLWLVDKQAVSLL